MIDRGLKEYLEYTFKHGNFLYYAYRAMLVIIPLAFIIYVIIENGVPDYGIAGIFELAILSSIILPILGFSAPMLYFCSEWIWRYDLIPIFLVVWGIFAIPHAIATVYFWIRPFDPSATCLMHQSKDKPKYLRIFKKTISKLATITEFAGVGFVMTDDDKEPDDGTPEQKQELFMSYFGGFFVLLLALCIMITGVWCLTAKGGILYGIFMIIPCIIATFIISFILPFIVRLLAWPLRAALRKKAILKIIVLCLVIVIVYSGAIAFCVTQCVYAVDPYYDFSDTLGFDIPDIFEQRPKYDYYIGNIQTKKYHEPSCSYLPYPKNRVNIPVKDIDKSQYRQYSPCGHCNP